MKDKKEKVSTVTGDLFMKVVKEVARQAIEMGMEWQRKVYLRCAIEGCVYGVKGVNKEPRDHCMYCGKINESKLLSFWGLDDTVKPLNDLLDKTMHGGIINRDNPPKGIK
ncbi:MAG: hypothetical protein PHW73_15205 [Atribacterota bacterium]|nr:hypothetical protein [Atribacterota bacterium]